MSSGGGNRRQMDQEFELNIASIVDCFTVLITYLLAAASFISLGSVEIESLVQRNESTGSQLEATTVTETPPKVILDFKTGGNVSVSVWRDTLVEKREFSMNAQAGETLINREPAAAGHTKPSSEYVQYLTDLNAKYPTAKQAILVGDGAVPYGSLVKWVEPAKTRFSLFFGDSP